MNKEKVFREMMLILPEERVPESLVNFHITCVDPKYPWHDRHSDAEIRFDENHIQERTHKMGQLFLAVDAAGGSVNPVPREESVQYLETGLIQIAYDNRQAVMSLPGDSYAFHSGHGGFAFGRPDIDNKELAMMVLRALVGHSENPWSQKSVLGHCHPDCGQYAHMTAARIEQGDEVTLERMTDHVKHLSGLSKFKDAWGAHAYTVSGYHHKEARDKRDALLHIQNTMVSGNVISGVSYMAQPYVMRTPSLVGAIAAHPGCMRRI